MTKNQIHSLNAPCEGFIFKCTLSGFQPSVKDIMDKYYEMFRDENSANKKELFNSPDSPDHSDQDSDSDW